MSTPPPGNWNTERRLGQSLEHVVWLGCFGDSKGNFPFPDMSQV